MSAVTDTRSPTVRLMGKRPQSTCGCTFSMTTRRVKAGSMALFSSPGIRGTDLPALSSRPLVKDKQVHQRLVGARKNSDIWPVFQIYHRLRRSVGARQILLYRVSLMRQRSGMVAQLASLADNLC